MKSLRIYIRFVSFLLDFVRVTRTKSIVPFQWILKEKPAGAFGDQWYTQITETKIIYWLKRLSKQVGIACKFEEGHEKNLNLAYEKEVIKPRAYQVKLKT